MDIYVCFAGLSRIKHRAWKKCQFTLITVVENLQKCHISKCERSELRLHFSALSQWLTIAKNISHLLKFCFLWYETFLSHFYPLCMKRLKSCFHLKSWVADLRDKSVGGIRVQTLKINVARSARKMRFFNWYSTTMNFLVYLQDTCHVST